MHLKLHTTLLSSLFIHFRFEDSRYSMVHRANMFVLITLASLVLILSGALSVTPNDRILFPSVVLLRRTVYYSCKQA